MLTGKQKRFLSPIFQVGKAGVNDNMIKQINDALEARELLKISVLQNCEEDPQAVAESIANETGADIAQMIGKTIVLYKESKENKQITLP
jgi:RNA-binding protein